MRPNSQRAKNAINALVAVMIGFIITTIATYVLSYMLIDLFTNSTDFMVAQNRLLTYSMIVGVIALIQLGVYITCIVLFIMWFRRAYFNLHKLLARSRRLKYSEGMAAGAWFIPIFNLFGPYQIANDLFYESEKLLVDNGLMEKQPKFHQVKGWWWGLWIASIVFNQVARNVNETAEFSTTLLTGGLVLITTLGSGILAIQMIKNYSYMENLLKEIEIEDQVSNIPRITNDDLLDSGI